MFELDLTAIPQTEATGICSWAWAGSEGATRAGSSGRYDNASRKAVVSRKAARDNWPFTRSAKSPA